MLDSAFAAFALVAFVLPGFLTAQVAHSRRAVSATESDWMLVLRALSYAILIHAAFLFWTAHLYNAIHERQESWTHHVWAVTAYALVVVVAAPLCIGYVLGRVLQTAEKRGQLRWWHFAMGARDVRDAWDFAFQRVETEAFVIVRTDKELVAGKFTRGSWAGRTPAPHDLFLEEVWLLNDGEIVMEMEPKYSVWIPQASIRDIYIARA